MDRRPAGEVFSPSGRTTAQVTATAPEGLLRYRIVRSILTSAFFPGILRAASVVFFALILYFALFGTDRGGQNFATRITWTIWWPLLPISLVLFGRLWCAVCPLVAAADVAQSVAKPKRDIAPLFLRKYGIWLMALTFIFLTWIDRVANITGAPRATGILLAILLGGAVLDGLLFRRRVWCRYICPIGALTGLYSMASVVELRARPGACVGCRTKDCYQGNERAAGCPLMEFPRAMESNHHCSLCANCLKSCPHDSLELKLRPPWKELANIKRPVLAESFLALAMVALVYVQSFDMTIAWGDYMKWLIVNTGLEDYNLAFSLTFLAVIAAALGSFWLTSGLSARLSGLATRQEFCRYGYAYLPIALAGHLGHNLTHLVGEGPSALVIAGKQLGLPLAPPAEGAMADVGWLAFVILATGSALALWVARAIGRSSPRPASAIPHIALLIVFVVLFALMFALPMNPRHVH